MRPARLTGDGEEMVTIANKVSGGSLTLVKFPYTEPSLDLSHCEKIKMTGTSVNTRRSLLR